MPEGTRADLELGTIPGLLAMVASRHAEQTAVEDQGTSLPYRDLAAVARRAARALIARGISRGDRVAIWAPNRWEWIAAALATHSVGAVLVPINTRFKGGEAAWVLARAEVRAIFTVREFLGQDYLKMLDGTSAPEARRGQDQEAEALPALETRVLFDGEDARALGWNTFLSEGDRVTDDDAGRRAREVAPGDLADLMFTSGTTGKPKGVMCTHAQTLRAYRDWAEIAGLRAADRYLVVPPFFHSFGYKAGWLASLMMGATILPQAVFDVDAVLARIARDRVSVLPGPPTLYQSLLSAMDAGKAPDLRSLRLAVTGAAVVPVELVRRMRRDLGFETVLTAYGLTESSGFATMCRRDDDAETIATTSGRAIPGMRVRVVDANGQDAEVGKPGEVLVSGYAVTKGYWGDREETDRAIDADGWLHTGDIGTLDARGYLAITDRLKDMFIVGGFNAYPAEIEQALAAHPAVAQVAVVGMKDERLGEVGIAFVVARAGHVVDEGEIVAWSRERMANYKVPRRVVVVEKLPTNASGKVVKGELRSRVRG
jgi:HIP---CoA ligase